MLSKSFHWSSFSALSLACYPRRCSSPCSLEPWILSCESPLGWGHSARHPALPFAFRPLTVCSLHVRRFLDQEEHQQWLASVREGKEEWQNSSSLQACWVVLVHREGMHNLKPTQKPSLDSPAICSVIFISWLHQHMLSSKWNFMTAETHASPAGLDWISSKLALLSLFSLSVFSSLWQMSGEGRLGDGRRPPSNLLNGSQETHRTNDAVFILAADMRWRHQMSVGNMPVCAAFRNTAC